MLLSTICVTMIVSWLIRNHVAPVVKQGAKYEFSKPQHYEPCVGLL
jgi:hypothetical protein